LSNFKLNGWVEDEDRPQIDIYLTKHNITLDEFHSLYGKPGFSFDLSPQDIKKNAEMMGV
jgi:hypothetical protein